MEPETAIATSVDDGSCVECGMRIEEERLKEIPYAMRCSGCAIPSRYCVICERPITVSRLDATPLTELGTEHSRFSLSGNQQGREPEEELWVHRGNAIQKRHSDRPIEEGIR